MAEQEQEEFTFGVEDWKKFWKDDMIGFHLTVVNPFLTDLYERLVAKRTGLRWFLPLCGKSLDMKWLADKGHHVVGLDCSEKAAAAFFEEHKLKYSVMEVAGIEGGKVYKSEDGQIEFYLCDYFKATSEVLGKFDIVWDYGAYYAISGMQEKQRYATLLRTFVRSGGQVLLDIMEPKDKTSAADMGFDVILEEDVKRMFDWCTSCELVRFYEYKDVNHLFYSSGKNDECSIDDSGKVYLLVAK